MRDTIDAVIVASDLLTQTIRRLQLASGDGAPLPAVEPGAHISVHTPAGAVRSYSITEVTPEGHYVLCVARDDGGRGGSVSMHGLRPGDSLALSAPKNAFRLVDAASYLFIAGGIGITPIRAMYDSVRGHAKARLVYLSRSADEAAFLEQYRDDPAVTIHHSAASGRFDLWDVLALPDDETHLYCCASTPLMEHVRMLTMHWRPSRLHFEDFAGVSATGGLNASFTARWDPEQLDVPVPADSTLLRALRDAGIPVQGSCESGTCGTCILRLVGGEADHRDLVLTEDERTTRIMPCVSRAAESSITVAPVD
jgi:phthalate 4,5-dioxygenase reductase subunit